MILNEEYINGNRTKNETEECFNDVFFLLLIQGI